MNTAKAAIAHTENMVARLRFGFDLGHQLVNAASDHGPVNHRRQRGFGVPVQAVCVSKGDVG